MSGGTVQTRTGKVDPTMKFKCTEAANDLVCEVFLKFTSTSFLLYSSTPILYLIPHVLKYTYKAILYLIPLVLKYTYTLPDSVCTQVHLYST